MFFSVHSVPYKNIDRLSKIVPSYKLVFHIIEILIYCERTEILKSYSLNLMGFLLLIDTS